MTVRVKNLDISFRNNLMTSCYHNFCTPNFKSFQLKNEAEFKNEVIEENRQWQ